MSYYGNSKIFDEKIKELYIKRSKARAQERKREQGFRRHVLVMCGFAVEQVCGSDWSLIDVPAFFNWIEAHKEEIAQACKKREEELPTSAYIRARNFETHFLDSSTRRSIYRADSPVPTPHQRVKHPVQHEDIVDMGVSENE